MAEKSDNRKKLSENGRHEEPCPSRAMERVDGSLALKRGVKSEACPYQLRSGFTLSASMHGLCPKLNFQCAVRHERECVSFEGSAVQPQQ